MSNASAFSIAKPRRNIKPETREWETRSHFPLCGPGRFFSLFLEIGKSVHFLLIGLVPPVIGNLIILCSTRLSGAVIGCCIYFLGMNLAVCALLRFTFYQEQPDA